MKIYNFHHVFIFSIIFLLFVNCFIPISITQNANQNNVQFLNIDNGQIFFAPMYSYLSYLINNNGEVTHTWESNYFPGEAAYMLDDGVILRTIKVGFSGAGGAGGGVQKIAWDGALIWNYRYNTNGHLSHHDIKPLPNGNVLLIAWETKTRTEAIDAGLKPENLIGNTLWPDQIIEVMPTGLTTGDIVWEWNVWDHLIQDYDPSKDNNGIVANHPELVDINYYSTLTDWLHTNSIDYNEELDQIMLSVHNFNEIWIIDHSTTTEEAAGHTGGNSGKGGDLLYRWGNPQTYDAGDESDQKFFSQHDATWIKPGCPGEGNILVFNNGVGRPGGSYSSVDEIVPPIDDNGNYYLEFGSSYGPEDNIWSYTADNPTDWYAPGQSGAVRIFNGNTLICDASAGKFFEVTSEKEIVWEYVNPYPNPFQNNVFKIQYIQPDETSPYANFIFSPDTPKQNEIVNFNDKSTDDEQIISWYWDFGDGNTSTNKNPTNRYSDYGTYIVTLKVTDNDGFIDNISKNIMVLSNVAPTPPSINGPTNGKMGVSYKYIFNSISPLGNDIYYYVDWGDNVITDWTGPYASGQTITINHAFNAKGTFIIKARCKDTDSLWGPWGEFTVSIKPKNRTSINSLFFDLAERLPILVRLMNTLDFDLKR